MSVENSIASEIQRGAEKVGQLSAPFVSSESMLNKLLGHQKEGELIATKKIELLDTVALLEDVRERGLERGEVGTVVELLGQQQNRSCILRSGF